MPVAVGLGMLVHPAAAFAILIYPAQICRIAMRQGGDKSTSWAYALFIVLAKFAELQGVLKFQLRRLSGRAGPLIEYK
jgi:hypothetical protein